MTTDLYTPDDVRKLRILLLKEQQHACAITGVKLASTAGHLDHAHDSEQLVRGVLHPQANMLLGRLEGLVARFLYFYPEGLPTFLRCCADYLERPKDTRWRHPGWMKKLGTEFNKLTAKQQDQVLVSLGDEPQKNLALRKVKFKKLLLDRKLGYSRISEAINKVKG